MAGLLNPFDKALAPNDAWSRMQYRRYGGRSDDIIAYSMQEDSLMNRSISDSFRSSGRAGGGGTNWLGSGSVNTNYGGGNTPSNPGGYNYKTLNNTIGGAAEMVNWGFDTRNKLRNNQDKINQKVNMKNAREWNTEVLPVQRAAFAKKQAEFNQPRSPATGKPSKAKNAKPTFGPAKPDLNLNPIKP